MLIFAIVIIVFLVLALVAQSTGTTPTKQYNLKRYYKKDSILTQVEKWAYKILIETVPEGYLVAPKVGMKDFVGVKNGKDYYRHFGHIAQKHIDFLICRKDTLSPVLGIELDDGSHQKADRKKRDIEVSQIYNTIEFNVIHISTKIKEDELRKSLNEIFRPTEQKEDIKVTAVSRK